MHTCHRLGPHEKATYHALLDLFAQAFDDEENYTSARPSAEYIERRLQDDSFIALVVLHEGVVVGGLAAYELIKFEQERSEIYIYDIAVAEEFRRRGIAAALIEELRCIAVQRGAWTIFVQADTDEDDQAAIALYSKLGTREDVLHFDIPVRVRG